MQVLDHTVTKRDWYDFFLVSQHVGQGTVSPTHYIVVHDNTGLKPDIIQKVISPRHLAPVSPPPRSATS